MADLTKVRQGDALRIPAAAYNAFVDAAIAHQASQRNLGAGDLAEGGAPGLVPVRNNSQEDVARFGVLGIDGPLFTPGDGGGDEPDEFRTRVTLKGVAPKEDRHVGRFVIAREPIVKGRIGQCVIHGVTPARVLIEDEAHQFADIAEDETVLRSGATGAAAILWKEEGTGEKWAVVEVGRPPRDRIIAILGEAEEIHEQKFRWKYPWREARIDGDPTSDTYGRYVAWHGGLSSKDADGDEDPAKQALNRFEAHLATLAEQPDDEGTEGFANAGACLIPGVQQECPPAKAAIPMLKPIMPGVAVALAAERDTRGRTVWTFQALNGIDLVEMDVPGWLYA